MNTFAAIKGFKDFGIFGFWDFEIFGFCDFICHSLPRQYLSGDYTDLQNYGERIHRSQVIFRLRRNDLLPQIAQMATDEYIRGYRNSASR